MPIAPEDDKITDRVIIAAEKGWTIVRDGGTGLTRPEPVIAWAIERGEGDWSASFTAEDRERLGDKRIYYLVTPITVEGAANMTSQLFAIKEPNGWYIFQHDTSFKDGRDLVAHWQELHAIEAAQSKPAGTR
jgi:hypothetical protein